MGGDDYRAFLFEGDGTIPKAAVALHLDRHKLEVVNITSPETSHLQPATYNQILQRFAAALFEPAAAEVGLSVVTSMPHVSLPGEIGAELAELLAQFSGAANQSTGSSHPADFRRWARFLVRLHRSGKRLDGDLLEATLREQGWSTERAGMLVREAEFARDLLSVADLPDP